MKQQYTAATAIEILRSGASRVARASWYEGDFLYMTPRKVLPSANTKTIYDKVSVEVAQMIGPSISVTVPPTIHRYHRETCTMESGVTLSADDIMADDWILLDAPRLQSAAPAYSLSVNMHTIEENLAESTFEVGYSAQITLELPMRDSVSSVGLTRGHVTHDDELALAVKRKAAERVDRYLLDSARYNTNPEGV